MSNLSCSVLFNHKLIFLHFRLQKYTFGQILFRKYIFGEVTLLKIKQETL